MLAWLASSESSEVTGRVWEIFGGNITVFDGYRRDQVLDIGKRWDPSEIGPVVGHMLESAQPLVKVYGT